MEQVGGFKCLRDKELSGWWLVCGGAIAFNNRGVGCGVWGVGCVFIENKKAPAMCRGFLCGGRSGDGFVYHDGVGQAHLRADDNDGVSILVKLGTVVADGELGEGGRDGRDALCGVFEGNAGRGVGLAFALVESFQDIICILGVEGNGVGTEHGGLFAVTVDHSGLQEVFVVHNDAQGLSGVEVLTTGTAHTEERHRVQTVVLGDGDDVFHWVNLLDW